MQVLVLLQVRRGVHEVRVHGEHEEGAGEEAGSAGGKEKEEGG